MSNFITAIVTVVGAIAIILVIGFLMSWPVMLLWNGCLVDAVTGVKEISWLQAWGITILCGFLFKSSSTTSSK